MTANGPLSPFTSEERERYARHFLLPEVGPVGQEKLRDASVLVVGAGGLGAPALLYLSAAGIGHIGIVDDDHVSRSNLQRQVIFDTADQGKSKAATAAERVRSINPHTRVTTFENRITAENAVSIASEFDVLLDGSDNLPTRYLISDLGVKLDKPVVHGAVYRFEGQLTVFPGAAGPCYRCLFPTPPPPELVPSCAEGGVLGALPGIIGSMQALEAIKVIASIGSPLVGRLVLLDGLTLEVQRLQFERDPQCICGGAGDIALVDYAAFCSGIEAVGHQTAADQTTAGHAPAQSPPRELPVVSPTDLATELRATETEIVLIDVRTTEERAFGHIGGELITRQTLQSTTPGEEYPADANIVVYCRTGRRSAAAVQVLLERGFEHVRNLEGGLVAWRDEVDATLEVY